MEMLDLNDVQIAFKHKSNNELRKMLFIYKMIQRPTMVKFLTKVSFWIIKYKLPFKFMLKNTVFEVFCAGENKAEVENTMRKLKTHHVNTVLDYVAEGDNSEEGFERNLTIIKDNILLVEKQDKEAFVGVKLSSLEDVNFIETVNAENVTSDPLKIDRMKRLAERVDQICKLSQKSGVRVYFDAEEIRTQDVYDDIVEKMMEEFNKQDVLIYNTFQMYRVDRLDYLETLIDRAKSKSYKIGLKLVRGAYYEKEKELAQNLGKVQPVYELKEETDQAYDSAVEICLKNHELVHTCIATHNKESVEKAIVLIQQLGMTDHYNKVYFSQLYGMSDNLTFNLAEANFNSSKYVPYGELEKAIPYLLRRAEENSSIEGQVGREYKLLLEEKSRRGM